LRCICDAPNGIAMVFSPLAYRARGSCLTGLALQTQLALLALRAGQAALALCPARPWRSDRAGFALRSGLAPGSRLALRSLRADFALEPALAPWTCGALGPAPQLQGQKDVGGGGQPLDISLADMADFGLLADVADLCHRADAADLGDFLLVDLVGFGHGLQTPQGTACAIGGRPA
jgi:hypothetical protein